MSAAPTPLLKFGSLGDAVRLLQKALNLAPSLQARLAEDAVFGPKTRTRVVEFQGKHRLASDGEVGPITWAALEPWLKLVKGLAENTLSPASEAAARERIRQTAENSLALYGWNGLLPKNPKTRGIDPAALRANPLRIAAAYCSDSKSPMRPRAGGASLALIFQGAGGTKAAQTQLCMTISPTVEAQYQAPAGPAKTAFLNQSDIGSWCGVFATFVCRLSGLKLSGWPLRTNMGAADAISAAHEFQKIDITDEVRVGDLGIYDASGSNHHFIVVDVAGDTIATIDGNVGDPDPNVIAPWSSVIARRSYTRMGPRTLKSMRGSTSANCYFMRPVWRNVL